MIALIVATVLAQATVAAPEPFPFSPEGEKLADTGYELFTHGKAPEAIAPLRELTRIAQDNPRGHRLLGLALLAAGNPAEAEKELTRAIDLKVDPKRLPSTYLSRAEARLRHDDVRGAQADTDIAGALDSDDPQYHAFSGFLHARLGNWDRAAQAATKAIELAPDLAFPHALLANALIELHDHDRSRIEAAKARALGFGDTRWLEAIDESNRRAFRVSLLWKVPLACVVTMAVALLVLFVAGAALSRAQVASLASLHPHMLRDEQTSGERLVLRAYLGVLWFGTIFFYISVPAMVLLSLVVGIGLVWLMLTQLSHIPLKIVAILFVAGVGGTWAVLRGLFLPASAEAAGKEITEADEPGLFAALREVGEVARTRMVDRVYLELGSQVAVRESGGGFRVLLGGGKRVLHLGYWALHGLTVSELKSVLAHEYGHFSHGETRLTPVVSRILETVVGMLQRMAALGGSTMVNPVYWYLRIYFRAFLATTSGHSRRRELLADRAAAVAYGGDVFGNALRRVVENGVYFDRQAGNVAVLLRESGRPCTAIYRALEASSALTPRRLRDERLREVLDSKPETFDSHPPPSDRIARVAGVRGIRPEEASPAYSLLRDAEETSQLLAGVLQETIDAQLANAGQPSRASSPMDAGAQVLFAEGLELHDAAVALQELDDAACDGLFASSVERLEAALGAKDPLLVAALKNLARSQQRLGHKADAQATLNRAVGIVAEHPDVAEERALREMMNELAAA